ncbi:cation:H+ antiporter [Pseudooceanicola antarcticus]|uniref:Cation:H+ antiporter n=1 Tax=Pseudooceanicola antarcticus TaxID=1247613 RepID=A0A285IR07_9RHOB|nr:calcium/sodium antiporter [Pseudooceanicola antarcticus]PJE31793.1 sodium:proton exchanger [Pseudooceanicola antarcticus]SNY50402.1 cation:H+ antiporter [Pseudooceanicola antarcticus]
MLVWLMVALGLVILLLAGDMLVRGAVNLALRVGIPALLVSLTIVAFGTSAPELLISLKAAAQDKPGLALGNVVGSNTANILLVLGIPAILATMHTGTCETRKSFVVMIGGTLLFLLLALRGQFDLLSGVVLLSVLALILMDQGREALRHRRDGAGAGACAAADDDELEEIEGADPHMPWWKVILYLVLGLVGLPFGASILVDSASEIARDYGISETVIGLTLVALGTSLPELATTVMAALRRQADVALGNVIGSNLFNLLAIIGVTSLFAKIPVDMPELQFDFAVMLGASLLLIPFVFLGRDINRLWGIVLSALYVAYVFVVLS